MATPTSLCSVRFKYVNSMKIPYGEIVPLKCLIDQIPDDFIITMQIYSTHMRYGKLISIPLFSVVTNIM